MNPRFTDDGSLSRMVRPHAERRMSEVLTGPLQRAQELFGQIIPINDALARDGTTRETETPGSRHFHGDAVDINISGFSPQEQLELLNSLLQAGFQGFGIGSGILHADMRPGGRAMWNYLDDNFDSTAFGGITLREVYSMIEEGSISPVTLSVSGELQAPYIEETRSLLFGQGPGQNIEEATTRGPIAEYDPEEGQAQGIVYLDNAPDRPGEGGGGSVSQGPERQGGSSETAGRREGSETIESLIQGLTEQINFLSEEERERVRATLARELGLTPTRRPERDDD